MTSETSSGTDLVENALKAFYKKSGSTLPTIPATFKVDLKNLVCTVVKGGAGSDVLPDVFNARYSEEKEDLIKRIAKEGLKVMGVNVSGEIDTDKAIKTLEKVIPDKKKGTKFTYKFENSSKDQIDMCKNLGKAINSVYDKNVIDMSAETSVICKKVVEFVLSLMNGLQSEFLEVADNLARTMNNMDEVCKLVDASFHKMKELATANGGNAEQIDAVEKVYNLIKTEYNRQYAILSNIINVSVVSTNKNLVEILDGNKDLREIIKTINGKVHGTPEFGDVLSSVLSGVTNTIYATSLIRKKLDEMGVSIKEFAAVKDADELRAKLFDSFRKKDLSSTELSRMVKAMEIIISADYNHEAIASELLKAEKVKGKGEKEDNIEGGCGCITGGSDIDDDVSAIFGGGRRKGGVEEEGNKYWKEKSLGKKLDERRKAANFLLTNFNELLKRQYDKIVIAADGLMKQINEGFTHSDELDKFISVFTNLESLDREDLYRALSGYEKDATSRGIRESFLNSYKMAIATAEPLFKDPKYGSHFKAIAAACSDMVKEIDGFTDKMVKTITELHVDTPAEIREKIDRDNSLFGAGERRGTYISFTKIKNDLRYYYNIANIKSNMANLSVELESYSDGYEEILGEEAGWMIEKIRARYSTLIKNCDWQTNKGSVGEQIKNIPNVALAGGHAGFGDNDRKEIADTYVMILEKQRNAKIKIIEVAQAIDLYLKSFTNELMKNPDSIKSLLKVLDNVEVTAKWFTDKSGDSLATLFDFFPSGKDGANSVYLSGPDVINDNGQVKFLIEKGKHYFETLQDKMLINAPPVAAVSVPNNLPGNPFIGRTIDKKGRVTGMYKLSEKILTSIKSLENILIVFNSVGSDVKSFMSPAEIYNGLCEYIIASAFTTGFVVSRSQIYGAYYNGLINSSMYQQTVAIPYHGTPDKFRNTLAMTAGTIPERLLMFQRIKEALSTAIIEYYSKPHASTVIIGAPAPPTDILRHPLPSKIDTVANVGIGKFSDILPSMLKGYTNQIMAANTFTNLNLLNINFTRGLAADQNAYDTVITNVKNIDIPSYHVIQTNQHFTYLGRNLLLASIQYADLNYIPFNLFPHTLNTTTSNAANTAAVADYPQVQITNYINSNGTTTVNLDNEFTGKHITIDANTHSSATNVVINAYTSAVAVLPHLSLTGTISDVVAKRIPGLRSNHGGNINTHSGVYNFSITSSRSRFLSSFYFKDPYGIPAADTVAHYYDDTGLHIKNSQTCSRLLDEYRNSVKNVLNTDKHIEMMLKYFKIQLQAGYFREGSNRYVPNLSFNPTHILDGVHTTIAPSAVHGLAIYASQIGKLTILFEIMTAVNLVPTTVRLVAAAQAHNYAGMLDAGLNGGAQINLTGLATSDAVYSALLTNLNFTPEIHNYLVHIYNLHEPARSTIAIAVAINENFNLMIPAIPISGNTAADLAAVRGANFFTNEIKNKLYEVANRQLESFIENHVDSVVYTPQELVEFKQLYTTDILTRIINTSKSKMYLRRTAADGAGGITLGARDGITAISINANPLAAGATVFDADDRLLWATYIIQQNRYLEVKYTRVNILTAEQLAPDASVTHAAATVAATLSFTGLIVDDTVGNSPAFTPSGAMAAVAPAFAGGGIANNAEFIKINTVLTNIGYTNYIAALDMEYFLPAVFKRTFMKFIPLVEPVIDDHTHATLAAYKDTTHYYKDELIGAPIANTDDKNQAFNNIIYDMSKHNRFRTNVPYADLSLKCLSECIKILAKSGQEIADMVDKKFLVPALFNVDHATADELGFYLEHYTATAVGGIAAAASHAASFMDAGNTDIELKKIIYNNEFISDVVKLAEQTFINLYSAGGVGRTSVVELSNTINYPTTTPINNLIPGILSGVSQHNTDINNRDKYLSIAMSSIPNWGATDDHRKQYTDFNRTNERVNLTGWTDNFYDTDPIYHMCIKSVLCKVFTSIDAFRLFNRPTDLKNYYLYDSANPLRGILGGGGKNGGGVMPEILVDAVELYVRLPLLAEWYREKYAINRLNNGNKDLWQLSLVPSIDGVWSEFFDLLFNKIEYINNGTYTENQIQDVVREINAIYKKYKAQKYTIRNIINAFVIEINRVMGFLKQREIDVYMEDRNKLRENKSYEETNDDFNDFDLIGSKKTMGRSAVPSDKYRSFDVNITKQKESRMTILQERIIELRTEMDRDLLSQHSQNRAPINFNEHIKGYRANLESAKSEQEKFNIVVNIIQNNNNISVNNIDTLIMFNETVCVPLFLLYNIYKVMAKFNALIQGASFVNLMGWFRGKAAALSNKQACRTEFITWLKAKYRTIDDITVTLFANTVFDTASACENNMHVGYFKPLDDNLQYIALPYSVNTLQFLPYDKTAGHTIGSITPGDIPALWNIDLSLLVRDVYASLLDLGSNPHKLVNVNISDQGIFNIDYSKLEDLSFELFNTVKHNLNKLRVEFSEPNKLEIIKKYENSETPGSVRWLEENLFEILFKNRDKTGLQSGISEHLSAFGSYISKVPIDTSESQILKGTTLANAVSELVYYSTDDTKTNVRKTHIRNDLTTFPFNIIKHDLIVPVNINTITELKASTNITAIAETNLLKAPQINFENVETLNDFNFMDPLKKSLLWVYNKLVHMYIKQNMDESTLKIHPTLLEGFVNSSASKEILQDLGIPNMSSLGHADPTDIANLIWTDVDKTGGLLNIMVQHRAKLPPRDTCLFSSTARLIHSIQNQIDERMRKKKYLFESFSEIPEFLKDRMRANLPIYSKLFSIIIQRAELLKRILTYTEIKDKIPLIPITVNHYSNLYEDIRNMIPNIPYVEPNLSSNEHKEYLILMLNRIVMQSESLKRCSEMSYKELQDSTPLYMDLYKDFISDSKQSGILPFMPLSMLTLPLNSYNVITNHNKQAIINVSQGTHGVSFVHLLKLYSLQVANLSESRIHSTLYGGKYTNDHNPVFTNTHIANAATWGRAVVNVALADLVHYLVDSGVPAAAPAAYVALAGGALVTKELVDVGGLKDNGGAAPDRITCGFAPRLVFNLLRDALKQPKTRLLIPSDKNGSDEYKFNYATRMIMRADIEPNIEHMPGVKEIYNDYIASAVKSSVISLADYSKSIVLTTKLVKFLNDGAVYAKLFDFYSNKPSRLDTYHSNSIFSETMSDKYVLKSYITDKKILRCETAGTGVFADVKYADAYSAILAEKITNDFTKPISIISPAIFNSVAAPATFIDAADGAIALVPLHITHNAEALKFFNSNEHKLGHHPIQIERDPYEMIRMIENKDKLKSKQDFANYIGQVTDVRNTDRNHLRINNILDLNIIPINVHAFMKEVPFTNLLNYSYTYDRMITEFLLPDFSRNATNLANNNIIIPSDYKAGTPRALLAKMLIHPYMKIEDMDEYYHIVASLFNGNDDLKLGRPKFLSDQLWHKVLMTTSVQIPSQPGFGGVSAYEAQHQLVTYGTDSAGVNDAILNANVWPGRSNVSNGHLNSNSGGPVMTRGLKIYKNNEWILLGNDVNTNLHQNSMIYLAELGKLRFDTKFVRDITWTVQLQRFARALIIQHLSWIDSSVVKGMKVVDPKITEFEANEQYSSDDFTGMFSGL